MTATGPSNLRRAGSLQPVESAQASVMAALCAATAIIAVVVPFAAGLSLLGTVPSVTGPREKRLRTIEGQPPILTADPDYCPFSARCRHVFNRCRSENPPRLPVGDGHDVACWWDPATDWPRDV